MADATTAETKTGTGTISTGASATKPVPPAVGHVNPAARALYGQRTGDDIPAGLKHIVGAHEQDERVVLGLDGEGIAARRIAQGTFLGETGLADDPLVAKLMLDAEYAVDVADVRGDDEDPRQAQRNAEETRRRLRDMFGSEDADRLIARMRAWIRTQPRLTTLLNRRGLGNRPDLIVPLAEFVRRRGL